MAGDVAATDNVKLKAAPKVKAKKRFAKGMNFYKLFWVFFIGCFLGVVIETVFVFVTTGKLMNRTGLVYGPFNLVYGFGALIMTICLHRLKGKSDRYIFLAGGAIGGAYEYACSWLQETFTGTVSWDYSEMKFNLGGRVNLLYCIFWGVLAVFWVKEIYPRLSDWIENHVPYKAGVPLTWVLVAFMLFNMAMSGLAVYRMSMRYEGAPATNAVEVFLDDHFDDARMHRIYPSMQHKK